MLDQENVTQVSLFAGFVPPVSNYFRMPNEWINICADITNLAELKVVQYVLRHTWGFQEYDGKPKPITVDEFMHGRKDRHGKRIDKGTGLKSDRSVKDGIKAAIEDGYLICEVNDADKARIVKAYALKMFSEVRQVESTPQNRQVESARQTGRIYPSEVQNLPPNQVESTSRSEKDTKEKNLKKEREKDASEQKPNVSTQEDFHSFTHSQSFSSQEEVVFSAEAEQVYQLAEQMNIVALKRDEAHKGYCEVLIAKGVTTQEKLESLMQHCWKEPYLAGKTLNLKNLVNALPGWLQLQRKTTAALATSPVTSTPGRTTIKWIEEQEKYKKRILEADAARGDEPRLKPSEMLARKRRQEAENSKLEDNFSKR